MLITTDFPASANGEYNGHLCTNKQFVRHALHRETSPGNLSTFEGVMAHAEAAGTPGTFLPRDIAAAYDFPTDCAPGGVFVILELGGGFSLDDVATAASRGGYPTPTVNTVSVDLKPTIRPDDAWGEVALDLQLAVGVNSYCTGGATVETYVVFSRDFASGIDHIIKMKQSGINVKAVSLSWGAPEIRLGYQRIHIEEEHAKKLAAAGIMYFVASGDSNAGDGTGHKTADYPASSAYACGTGGTTLSKNDAGVTWREVVWDTSSNEGTGGGYSGIIGVPAFQHDKIAVPKTSPHGRMVPDVAGNADPRTGYMIVVNGQWQPVGGTSAVAPIWAGYWAALNLPDELNNTATLWKLAAKGQPTPGFHDIESGNNHGYTAQVGPDPCTGLGTPSGKALATLLKT